MADRYDDETPHDPQLEARVQKYIDAAFVVVLAIAACFLILTLASCVRHVTYYDCSNGKCVPLKEPPCVCIPDGKHDICPHCTGEKIGPATAMVPQ
jgi:hypothetical protein